MQGRFGSLVVRQRSEKKKSIGNTLIEKELRPFDRAGSLNVNCGNSLSDCDHEGHGGWRIDEITSSLPTFLPLPSTPSADPDIVLLMLGTNDMGQNYFIDQAPERLRSLIENILLR